MVKIQIMSDLHNEFGEEKLMKTDADIYVLAGDIFTGKNVSNWLLNNFKEKVIFVSGNHEYYRHDIDTLNTEIENQLRGSNVYFLNNKKVYLEGIRFLGTTLWTDFRYFGDNLFKYYLKYSQRSIDDFSRISYKHKRFTPEDAIHLHEQSKKFLEDNLLKMYDGKTVVVTHHAPLKECVGEEYRQHPLTPAFASDMSDLIIKYKPDVWIYGHLHGLRNFKFYDTRVICNPRGYPENETGFIPDLTINLER